MRNIGSNSKFPILSNILLCQEQPMMISCRHHISHGHRQLVSNSHKNGISFYKFRSIEESLEIWKKIIPLPSPLLFPLWNWSSRITRVNVLNQESRIENWKLQFHLQRCKKKVRIVMICMARTLPITHREVVLTIHVELWCLKISILCLCLDKSSL